MSRVYPNSLLSQRILPHNWLTLTGTLSALLLAAPMVIAASKPSAALKPPASAAPAKTDYNRDIRPILSENCFTCHGPDEAKRKAGLRLDLKDQAYQIAIKPGQPAASELIKRVLSHDADEQMPPPKSGKTLTAKQIALLQQWIGEGAEYKAHWAFIRPQRPPVPATKNKTWARNDIDRFILARLEQEKLQPAPEAPKEKLIRRVSLDLTGLPPTPQEVDAFLADHAPNAYEKVVDRLLASPHYGERMASQWLDLARYADTNGYQVDSLRTMWPWRDWVVRAFNKNMPYDRFTVEQIAGDLLPAPTLDQRLATGFNRNHRINEEGGSLDEEFRTEYVIDRVSTTSTVWLGLTAGCARCHDHKYDPISQKEFYQLYSFFNNIPERGIAGGNAAPVMEAPSDAQQQQLSEVALKISGDEERLKAPLPAVDTAQAAWEKTAFAEAKPVVWSLPDFKEVKSQNGATLTKQADGSVLVSGATPNTDAYTVVLHSDLPRITALRLEALPDDSLGAKGPGRAANGNFVLSEIRLTAGAATGATAGQTVKFKAATADYSQPNHSIAGAIDGKADKEGWAVDPAFGKPHTAIFQTAQPLEFKEGTVLTVTLDFQYGNQHQLGRFRLSVTGDANPLDAERLPEPVVKALAADKRTPPQQAALQTYYRTTVSTAPELKQTRDELANLQSQQEAVKKQIPVVMIMQEMAKPRDAFLLKRGQYDMPGDKVTAGVPACLNPFPANAPTNRLGLAQWMVDPANPLTARVAVNRYWQVFFGTGIVKTLENFGSQAEWPSHPELLDWLATEFVRTGWNVKAMQKLIVTSATYRQSSKVTPALLLQDPENRLLAHAPRLRLPAEIIRDQALAFSGLLVDKPGGPPVKPYQPPGLWEEIAYGPGVNKYEQDHGDALYRRSLYTFWRRTIAPPSMTTFDAPSREICTVNRSRTSTPLQALALLNDTIYVETDRKLAERMMAVPGTPAARLDYAFRLATARHPSPREMQILSKGFTRYLAHFQADKEGALKLLSIGESPHNPQLDAAELAAYTTTASVILNMDEVVTKE